MAQQDTWIVLRIGQGYDGSVAKWRVQCWSACWLGYVVFGMVCLLVHWVVFQTKGCYERRKSMIEVVYTGCMLVRLRYV